MYDVERFAIVRTSNFCDERVDEKFIGDIYEQRANAELEADRLNKPEGIYGTYYYKVVVLPYNLYQFQGY